MLTKKTTPAILLIIFLNLFPVFSPPIPAQDTETPQQKIQRLEKQLHQAQTAGDKKTIAETYRQFGITYLNLGLYQLATDNYLKSQALYEEIQDKQGLVKIYRSLGSLYNTLGDYDKTIESLQKALSYIDMQDSEQLKLYYKIIHSMGICYSYQGRAEQALEKFFLALKGWENIGSQFWIISCKLNIGKTYMKLENYSQALKYLTEAETENKQLQSKILKMQMPRYFGLLYYNMKKYSMAAEYFKKAEKMALESNSMLLANAIHLDYSNLYFATDDYKNAYLYLKRHFEFTTQLLNEEKNHQIVGLQEYYGAEQQKKEIALLKKDVEIKKLTRNAVIAGFIMLAIIFGLLVKRYMYLFSFWKKQKYIGQYRLVKTIGSGGMGTVYKAHSIRNKNELAAVKVLREEMTGDENSIQRFRHEGTIIDKLWHPNIVRVFERGDYNGKLFIAMEYLQGITLQQKIEETGPMDLNESLAIMRQTAEAIAYIHDKNIVHRDLKPANILLVEKNGNPNFVKLLDFGVALAKFQTRLTQSGILVGTISYIAPEQITENLYTPAGDVYALGVIFYEMLVGKQAFTGDSITSVVEKILDASTLPPIQSRADIPVELNDLIMKMLSRETGQRPSAPDVAAALQSFSR